MKNDIKKRKVRLRVSCVIVTMILLFLLSACNSQEEHGNRNDEYLVLDCQEEECLLLESDMQGELLGSQFFQDEIIQFWGVQNDNENSIDIYFCQENKGSQLLFEDVNEEFCGRWFLDNDCNYYNVSDDEICKINTQGGIVFRKEIETGTVLDICQMRDSYLYLLIDIQNGKRELLRVDSMTGEVCGPGCQIGDSEAVSIAAGETGVLLLGSDGIWKVDTEIGEKEKLIDFDEHKYFLSDTVMDFAQDNESEIRILYSQKIATLRLEDISKSRTIIKIRTRQFFDDAFMMQCITQFNQSNELYYVVVETLKAGEDFLDFVMKTNMELGTGAGADIIFYDAVNEPEQLLKKGVFVNLRPYMEASGIHEEDYFSAAFDFWKENDEIYAINMVARPTGIWISEDVLGDCQEINIATLIECLSKYKENAIFHPGWDSAEVLRYFLSGTEDLWGMIDWENRTCNLQNDLFVEMLEVADRYGQVGNTEQMYVAYPMLVTYYTYETIMQMRSEGKIPVGYLFDDGCFTRINQTGVMAINSNSDNEHRQGAWEFINFLISQEVQTQIGQSPYPVSKLAFEVVASREIEEGAITIKEGSNGAVSKVYKVGRQALSELNNNEEAYRKMYNLTEDKVDEIRNLLESSRALPVKVEPIIDIIIEEVGAYFSGSKSVEEVIKIIQNRVQLYFDEREF